MNEFDDIRPYDDAEVPSVISRLLRDNDFLDLLLSRRLPRLSNLVPVRFLMRPILRNSLAKLAADVSTVEDFQAHMTSALRNTLDKTTDGVVFSGLHNLDKSQAYLFMSNHRDIALDPALINLGLVEAEFNTVRIAIGDNLLRKPYASDLMRVNRSFIVKRSATGRREKLDALKTLSSYIRHSICKEKVSCWIAQAEGRAKNGIDRTETALLKMLALSKEEGQSFTDALGHLNIIPVSVSYEYDPCAADKAREMYAAAQGQTYVKDEFEDLDTIVKGLVGQKGRIQVNFGTPITAGFDSADQLAAEIDRQITGSYRLFPSNIIAWQTESDRDSATLDRLKQQWPDEDWLEARVRFDSQMASIPSAHRQIAIDAYAASVDNQLAILSQQPQPQGT